MSYDLCVSDEQQQILFIYFQNLFRTLTYVFIVHLFCGREQVFVNCY